MLASLNASASANRFCCTCHTTAWSCSGYLQNGLGLWQAGTSCRTQSRPCAQQCAARPLVHSHSNACMPWADPSAEQVCKPCAGLSSMRQHACGQ